MNLLTITFDTNEFINGDINLIMKYILKTNRETILTWLDKVFPEIEEDWNEYEGGIDIWWGLGSVLMFELDLIPTFSFKENDVIFTLKYEN